MFSPSFAMPAATRFWTGPFGSASQLSVAWSPACSISLMRSSTSCWESVIRGDAVADEPFARRAPRLPGGAGEAALAQDQVRFLEIAVSRGQRGFAFHHARARLVAELLHIDGGDSDGRC